MDHIGRVVQKSFLQMAAGAPGLRPGTFSGTASVGASHSNGPSTQQNPEEEMEEKHPVMMIGEICGKKGLKITFDVGERTQLEGLGYIFLLHD